MRTDTDRHGQARTGTDAVRRTARRGAGFTLMELLIVIAIMAIISTVAVGGYFGMMRAAAYSSAHAGVYNTLLLAKQRAVIDGKVTSLMILNATNYVVVRAVGRISHVDAGVAHDAYSDLSGALGTIDVFNLDSTGGGAFKKVTISRAIELRLKDEMGAPYTVPEGYRFEGAGAGFFLEGDRYGFALHGVQALPRGYLFTGALPREVRFNVDGSRIKPDSAPLEPITIEETIRKENKIRFEVAASGTVTDKSLLPEEEETP